MRHQNICADGETPVRFSKTRLTLTLGNLWVTYLEARVRPMQLISSQVGALLAALGVFICLFSFLQIHPFLRRFLFLLFGYS
jgi:hypothetical protein